MVEARPKRAVIRADVLNAAMVRYRSRGGLAAAQVLVETGYALPEAAKAVADQAAGRRAKSHQRGALTRVQRDVRTLVHGRHGGPCDTDDAAIYLEVVADAATAHQRATPNVLVWGIAQYLPTLGPAAIEAAIASDPLRLTAQQRGDRLALLKWEREAYGITTMRPAKMTAATFGRYRKRRRAVTTAIRRAASRPPRLTFRVGELARQIGVDRKTIQRALKDRSGKDFWRLIDRYLVKCPKTVATAYKYGGDKTATLKDVARSIEAQRSPVKYVDPIHYRQVVRPILAAIPCIIATLERVGAEIGLDATLGEIEAFLHVEAAPPRTRTRGAT